MPEFEFSPDYFTWLGKHARNLPYSQYGEDGILQAIFDRIGTTSRWCCEAGAGDGLFFSNTRRLIEQGWHAVLIEADFEKVNRCAELNADNERVKTVLELIRPLGMDSLDAILAYHQVPTDIDLLVLDIDGQECYVLNALCDYRPRVLMVEYNPYVDPMFMPALGAPTGQAGLQVMSCIALARGYFPIVRTECNLICVRKELAGMLVELPEKKDAN